MLFDGPSGEQASAQDGGSLDSLGLGEDEEIHLMEKFLKIIRANPEKAETRYGKFEKMVEEEEKVRDGTSAQLMRIRQPPLMRRKRSTEKKAKMGKKKKRVSKQKKVGNTKKKDQNGKSKNVKSQKRKSVKSKEKKINEKRKLGKMGKHITNNKNNNKLERKTQKKIKLISKMEKMQQKRKGTQGNRQKTKFLENCTTLWAELTNIGLGVAFSPTVLFTLWTIWKLVEVDFRGICFIRRRNFKSRLGKFIFRIGH